MRISDWSSDVCSSDLRRRGRSDAGCVRAGGRKPPAEQPREPRRIPAPRREKSAYRSRTQAQARQCRAAPPQEEWDAMSAPEQEHGLHVTDALKEYEQAIRTMPEKTRRVFLMRRVDGLSYREIHEQLGISISTVEYHMVRALGHLSDALEIFG